MVYLLGLLVVVGIVFLIIFFSFLSVFVRALVAGAPVGLFELVGMKLQRVPIGLIVDNRILAVKAGIRDHPNGPFLSTDQLVAHYQAGGNVPQVVRALIAADKALLSLDFKRAAAIDLATQQS